MSAGTKKIKLVDYDSRDSITTEEFSKKVSKLGNTGMAAEYVSICSESPASTFDAFNRNAEKNRYVDIQCYDERRIVLTSVENGDDDYIHANYVDGYRVKCGFICAQGPLMDTRDHFWQMVWQEGCVVIVSLTRMVEGGKNKCASYWPMSESKIVRYGQFRVCTQKIVEAEDHSYAISDIILEHTKRKEPRYVKHLLYLCWPDRGVPTEASEFLQFREVIREQSKEATANAPHWRLQREPPVVVHCAAGVGRTGTLVALDICLRQLELTGKVDVPGVVKKLRRQRFQAIQKAEQYAFLNLGIIEYAIKKNLLQADEVKLDGFLPRERRPDPATGTKEMKSDTAMV